MASRWTAESMVGGALACAAVWACGGDATTGAAGATSSTTSAAGGSGGATTSASGGGSTTSASGGGSAGGGGSTPVACPEGALAPGVHQQKIAFDGQDREYEVQIPKGYDNSGAVPLVIDMHGYTSTKDQQEGLSGWAALADAQGFVVVRPQGFGNSWNAGDFCCGQAQSQGLDDVGLMKAIVAEVRSLACVDERRVYASGLSNGGAMSHRLGCEAADVFAAVAPVSYPLDFKPLDKCQPSRPIAVMHSHGLGDLLVPYKGGFTAISAADSFAHWAKASGCQGDPVQTYSKGKSHCETYQACGAGVQVALCSVDGGHVLYQNSDQVPIAELAWDFLGKHTLP